MSSKSVSRSAASVVSIFILCSINPVFAAIKDKKTSPDKIAYTTVVVKNGKKQKSYVVACLNKTPGKAYTKKKKTYFRPLKTDELNARVQAMHSPTKKNKQKLKDIQALRKAATKGCKNPDIPPGGNPPGNPTPVPEELQLEKYTGPFGEREARILLTRFGIGATQSDVDIAVLRGLDATINDLLQWKDEPAITAYQLELMCDGRTADDPDNETCDPNRVNDLYAPGYRYGWYYGAIKSQNQFFYRLWLFLHDDFMAVNSNALEGCDQHALKVYSDMIWRASMSGDFKRLMQEFISDQLGALRYLNLGTSRAPIPNQDFARELWQLGIIGQNRPISGALNYDELDIINAANALAGWSIESFRDSYGDNVCYGALIPRLQVPGPHTIFHGSPYQTSVNSPVELLNATFNHPGAAENIAAKIYKEFINPAGGAPVVISQFAQEIRDSNFNLHSAMRKVMSSKALYHPKNRGALTKHPLQLVLGFLRQTGIPHQGYWQLENILSSLGQRPFQSPSVFGWYPERLAGEAYILERRNNLNWLVTLGDSSMEEEGYSLFDRYLQNLPAGETPSIAAIKRVSSSLGLALNSAQINELDEYMNFQMVNWGCPSQCGGASYRIIRDAFDAYKTDGNWSRQVRGLLLILASLPSYQVM